MATAGSPVAKSVTRRQRGRFNDLWGTGRDRPLSADQIRYGIWSRYLSDPVVEVGSGDGLLARTFPSRRIISVDQSLTGLRLTPPPKLAATGDGLPIVGGIARTVVCAEVLEHVEDPHRVLAECRRIARPDATLLVSVPTFPLAYAESLFHRLKVGQLPTLDNLSLWDPEHERRYSERSIQDLVTSEGWRVEEVIPIFGTATTAVLYFGDAVSTRLLGRGAQVAQYAGPIDRWVARWDRHSGVALVCSLAKRPS